MEGMYNDIYAFALDLFNLPLQSYSDYVQATVGYNYYDLIQESFLLPWKQVVYLQYASQALDSQWTVAHWEDKIEAILEVDLFYCEVLELLEKRAKWKPVFDNQKG